MENNDSNTEQRNEDLDVSLRLEREIQNHGQTEDLLDQNLPIDELQGTDGSLEENYPPTTEGTNIHTEPPTQPLK